MTTPRLALVGDRSPHVRSHTRVPGLLQALRERDRLDLDAYWVRTDDITGPDDLAGFDAVWLLPGSPYASEEGALAAVAHARLHGVPFLGTCGGFQHALLEFARAVCGLTTAAHAEVDPDAADPLVAPLACSLVGHEGAVHLVPGTLAERVLAADRTVERYHCDYGLNPRHLDLLREHGMVFSGHDADGEVRVAELPDHPFFLTTLFQPELAGDGTRPHPVITAFARAASASTATTPATAAGPARSR
ncbi:hypothetical protein AB0A74_40550 [Saccharothrix sp. NPDC042600]|uniref:CTP synthase C-terminal region-related (seleno)protein n=1 Tax=Saccharothrix TaxID=2071 RepID=UPI0033F2B9E2